MKRSVTAGKDVRLAKRLWGELSRPAITTLKQMIETHSFSLPVGDLLYLGGSWYVTHTGLLGLARRNRCAGIHVRPVAAFCDPTTSRWTFEATVYKSQGCRGFVGYGDADPSNVSPLIHGAELRIAETRAVNRALRKAWDRYLFGRGTRFFSCWIITLASGVEENSTTTSQRKLRWPQGTRPALSTHPPIPA